MYKLKNLLRRIEAKRQLAKEEGLGFDAGLTLLEVAAAIGISVILALVIVLALTGLFSSAKHSTAVQTLTNVSTAAQGFYGSNGGSYTGLTTPAVLSSQATGVKFTSRTTTTKSDGVIYRIGTQVAVFGTYDSGFGQCLYVADVSNSATTTTTIVLGKAVPSTGVWWGTDPSTGVCTSNPITDNPTFSWSSKVPTS